jgi:hypothetical protein
VRTFGFVAHLRTYILLNHQIKMRGLDEEFWDGIQNLYSEIAEEE